MGSGESRIWAGLGEEQVQSVWTQVKQEHAAEIAKRKRFGGDALKDMCEIFVARLGLDLGQSFESTVASGWWFSDRSTLDLKFVRQHVAGDTFNRIRLVVYVPHLALEECTWNTTC